MRKLIVVALMLSSCSAEWSAYEHPDQLVSIQVPPGWAAAEYPKKLRRAPRIGVIGFNSLGDTTLCIQSQYPNAVRPRTGTSRVDDLPPGAVCICIEVVRGGAPDADYPFPGCSPFDVEPDWFAGTLPEPMDASEGPERPTTTEDHPGFNRITVTIPEDRDYGVAIFARKPISDRRLAEALEMMKTLRVPPRLDLPDQWYVRRAIVHLPPEVLPEPDWSAQRLRESYDIEIAREPEGCLVTVSAHIPERPSVDGRSYSVSIQHDGTRRLSK